MLSVFENSPAAVSSKVERPLCNGLVKEPVPLGDAVVGLLSKVASEPWMGEYSVKAECVREGDRDELKLCG